MRRGKVDRNKEEKKMNKLFEREEGTIDKNVFYGEISEWLRISSVHFIFMLHPRDGNFKTDAIFP
jgi:hypothetical protein